MMVYYQCIKDDKFDNANEWKGGKYDQCSPKTPEQTVTKFAYAMMSGTPMHFLCHDFNC